MSTIHKAWVNLAFLPASSLPEIQRTGEIIMMLAMTVTIRPSNNGSKFGIIAIAFSLENFSTWVRLKYFM